MRQKEITRGGHSYIESGLPDYLTDREIQILREYVVGSQVSDPERVIEELKRRGVLPSGYQLSHERMEQARRIACKFPGSVPAYLEYELKGNASRVDEFRTIEHLLERDFHRRGRFSCTAGASVTPTALQQGAINKFAALIDLIQSVTERKILCYRAKADYLRSVQGTGKQKKMRDRSELRYLPEVFADIDRSFISAFDRLRARPAYEGLSKAVDGILYLDLERVAEGSSKLSRPSLLASNWREDIAGFLRGLRNWRQGKEKSLLEELVEEERAKNGDLPSPGRLQRLKDAARRSAHERMLEYLRETNPSVALDVVSSLIEYAVIYGPRSQHREGLLGCLIELHDLLKERAFDSMAVETQQCFLDDLVDKLKCCISTKGSEREASLIYRLDRNILVFALNPYRQDKRGGTMAKLLLVKAKDYEKEHPNEKNVLIVDGVIASPLIGKLLQDDAKNGVDWREAIYTAFMSFAARTGYPRVVVNISHGIAQQSVHEFVKYVADMQGFKERTDYTFDPENGVCVFRLTEQGYQRVSARTLPNGLRYTHHLKKTPISSKIVDTLGNGRWNGEVYLDSWFVSDSYDYLMRIRSENHLGTNDPYDILRLVRSTPELRDEFERQEFYWTRADGHVMGIEIDPLEMYLDGEMKAGNMSDEMAEEIRSLMRRPPIKRKRRCRARKPDEVKYRATDEGSNAALGQQVEGAEGSSEFNDMKEEGCDDDMPF